MWAGDTAKEERVPIPVFTWARPEPDPERAASRGGCGAAGRRLSGWCPGRARRPSPPGV